MPPTSFARRVAVLTFALSIAASALSAQTPTRSPAPSTGPGLIRGIVLDSASSTPLINALIIVRLASDTSRVTRAQVTATGAFTVPGLRAGGYIMRITAIGHGPHIKAISISDAATTVNVGTIKLGQFVVALQSVDVKAEAATVTIEPDRNSYKAKDVAPGAANASEVLEQTPSVSVDADGKVSLRGNESVIVQVNGRPTPMTGIQLGAYLKSLSASVIDRVEVMPNPSAKYDPDGTAGIINVVLKANVDLGLSGGGLLNLHSTSRYTAAGNLGYQRGALASALSVSATNDVRNTPGFNDLTVLDTRGSAMQYSNQDVEERTGGGGQTMSSTVDYKLNKRDLLSNALMLNHRMAVDETNTAYAQATLPLLAETRFDRRLRSSVSGVMFDEDIAFKRTYVPRRHELSAEVRFNRARESDSTTLWREEQTRQFDRELNRVEAIAKQLTAQVDYVRSPGTRTKIELGYKTNVRWFDRDYDVQQDSLGNGVWARSSKSNALAFREALNAGYGLLSHGIGKVEMQAGLRAEVADRDFNLATSSKNYPFRYASIFPSAVARYSVNERTELKASYSRRVRRPSSAELNPFPTFYDLQNVFVGNPQLNPEYTDAVELGFTRTGSHGTLQVSPFLRHTTNIIRTVIRTGERVEGRDVTTFTYSNIATGHSWGADVNASLPSGRKLTGFSSLNVFKTVVDGTPQASLSPTGFTWTWRMNATWQVTPTVMTNVAYIYRAAIPVANGHFYRAQNTNITVRKKLNDRSTLGLSVIDPLGTNTFHIAVAGQSVEQETQRTLGLRAIFLRYQYAFGRTPRVREVQPDGDGSSGRPS